MQYHSVAFLMGFVLDYLFGDPHWLFHPVRLIGKLIVKTEESLLKENRNTPLTDREKQRRGVLLVCIVLTVTALAAGMLLTAAYLVHPIAGVLAESVMSYQILAMKCLKTESEQVFTELVKNDLTGARQAVSRIVGRDTAALDEAGIIRAAVETVAENCSDGVIAPMLYLAVGGPVLGFLYKAVNTMDSMLGYKNEKYLYFGRAAAKLDDAVNYIPSRISAGFMIIAAFLPGSDFDGKNALFIFKRDRFQHTSPNSAQTESVCAGALGIRLGGDSDYFGKTVRKPYIGDARRKAEKMDIVRANRLLYRTAFLCEGICLLLLSLALL
ncbi:MAG: adenosylcobinamide-phosphate synthase CbiB [Lachnospiraceae bacterium]